MFLRCALLPLTRIPLRCALCLRRPACSAGPKQVTDLHHYYGFAAGSQRLLNLKSVTSLRNSLSHAPVGRNEQGSDIRTQFVGKRFPVYKKSRGKSIGIHTAGCHNRRRKDPLHRSSCYRMDDMGVLSALNGYITFIIPAGRNTLIQNANQSTDPVGIFRITNRNRVPILPRRRLRKTSHVSPQINDPDSYRSVFQHRLRRLVNRPTFRNPSKINGQPRTIEKNTVILIIKDHMLKAASFFGF